MKNKILEKLESNEKIMGTFFQIGGSNAVEGLGLAGLDFLIIDTEHGQFDVESSADYIRAAKIRDITPFVRVKDSSRASILKMLDIGAQGLVIPNVKSIDEVKAIVNYSKYSPLGQRGVALGREAGWGFCDYAQNIDKYFEICNKESLIFPQCETIECLENIEEIIKIDGVAGIFIGPFDLSVALGKPAQFNDSKFIEALNRILKACINANKYCLLYTGDAAGAKLAYKQGFHGVAVGMDISHYISAFIQLKKDVSNWDCDSNDDNLIKKGWY